MDTVRLIYLKFLTVSKLGTFGGSIAPFETQAHGQRPVIVAAGPLIDRHVSVSTGPSLILRRAIFAIMGPTLAKCATHTIVTGTWQGTNSLGPTRVLF
ncbi:hypothetical protein AMTR_s00142p00009840 [Amborella trichopoda]|uniref:Uncharacterized protein n=1 Tax=Amborella trichopoda TaxID=13333 RepID=W1PEF3_AMBTC|nr:hypothetical protein AMTR_s00142p00009840 [Amborella trichopoda]